MEVVVALRAYLIVVVIVMATYAIRHWVFTLNRLFVKQRPYYQDLLDQQPVPVSVLMPMHNESAVAEDALATLLASDYPDGFLEIIPIDDHSEDDTPEILRRYAAAYPAIRPLYRRGRENRGKPSALNDGLAEIVNEVVLVFDADYEPPPDTVRELAAGFGDPEVGAVMGRVIPRNTEGSLLARLLDLERAGGYQADQQARYSLDLIPQYGGTVAGFRSSLTNSWGGFDPRMLAEDTDLTFRLYTRGWRVAYANGVECYEEVPETWDARFKQLRRWARGHTQAMFRHLVPVIRSPYLSIPQKLDGLLLLAIYMIPPLLLTGLVANLLLFLTGAVPLGPSLALSFFVVSYNAFGNFAPFYQVGAAGLLDGMGDRMRLLPHLFFLFLFNSAAVSLGFVGGMVDMVKRRDVTWEKTERFRR
jgi:cellulose synthase/poly-beta-1,6-N-acetylglucosamine synthase-like glycosyltransferase